jgi:hypothetical protein
MDWSFGWFSGKKSQEQLAGELTAANAEKAKITENCNAQQKKIDEKIAELTSATKTPSAVAGDVKVNASEQKQETSASNPAAIKPKGGGKRRKQKSSKKMRGGKRKNTRRK